MVRGKKEKYNQFNEWLLYIYSVEYIYTQYNLKLKNLRNKENIKTLQIISVIGNY